MPKVTETALATRPTWSEMPAPAMTRLSTSRPISSVPRRCASDGPSIESAGDGFSGG